MVTLSAGHFLLSYVNDRSYLDIKIRSSTDPSNSLSLSFVRDLIYNRDNINSAEGDMGNSMRIEDWNNFLKNDFEKISTLFNPENYLNTQQQIDYGLKETFKKRFPGTIKE
jgi:hypothetical protein